MYLTCVFVTFLIVSLEDSKFLGCPNNQSDYFGISLNIKNCYEKFAVWLRKFKQGLCINLEGWDGEEDMREFQKGADICIPMADSF